MSFLFRVFLFFSLFFLTYVSAKEEWTIKKFNNLSYAQVTGEVTHGDHLSFFLRSENNCEKVWNIFTVYTYEKPEDIYDLRLTQIPIKINGQELLSTVQDISPFLMGYRFVFSLGQFNTDQYINFLNEFYTEFNQFEIEIVDGKNFKSSKYFDIKKNNWVLDDLNKSINQAKLLCRELL